MRENQYQLFRDLDRHCVAEGFKEPVCYDIVERKKQSIRASINQDNPVVREVLEGRSTFVEVYDDFSRAFRGVRRFVPLRHDESANARLEQLARIIPNVGHFRRRSFLAADNPVTCTVYGMVVGLAADLVWLQQVSDIEQVDSTAGHVVTGAYFFAVGFGAAGFLVGAMAMMRYRTRDPQRIHAREAAAYMDLNYEFYRNGDDEGWAHFIRAAAAPKKNLNRSPAG